MTNFQKLLKSVITEKISFEKLLNMKKEFETYATKVLMGRVNPDDPELEAFLRICLDVYTFSPDGEVLINDSLYDQVMNIYKSKNDAIIYSDAIGKTKWEFIKHEVPGVVGTINKIYSYDELKKYLKDYRDIEKFIIAPKFDGISCDIHLEGNKIISASTRYDGYTGQNITELVRKAKNVDEFIKYDSCGDGHYKCELCVANEEFNELINYKKYANRRSATSGIINTPKNIMYAKYITIIPLAYYNQHTKKYKYLAPGKKKINYYSPADLMEEIESMLEEIKKSTFPFRVDGVVIHPDPKRIELNEMDLMDNCIAYKINRAEGKTKIKYGYMSVGRLGKAVPMLKVYPVEVNETIVEDASLGSYAKFLSMDLREDEDVIVYSAGDVIPQIKLPLNRMNIDNRELLKIQKICPYCGEKLTRFNTEYYCTNKNCKRIITGKIVNFLDKMGVMGVSDKTIEDMYDFLNVSSIIDFLNLNEEDISKLPGYSDISAKNIIEEIKKIRNNEISISKFFGALGIDKISEKKCRKIFDLISLDKLLNSKNYNNLIYYLENADGVGPVTANTFIKYVEDNLEEIKNLYKLFNFSATDISYTNNVVFTGFRPPKDIEEKLKSLGIEISNTITRETLCLFSASDKKESTKYRTALRKGIPIYFASDLDTVIKELEDVKK